MTSKAERSVILTIDDDPVILNAVLEVLKHEYTVRPFTSAKEALSYLEDHHVDLILLDHNMPSMTGLELLQVLQSDPKTQGIPVIFLTGSTNSLDEVRALQIGAMDYLLKPFNPSSLLTRVKLQLELYQHRNRLEELVEERTEELRELTEKLKQRDKNTIDLLAIASDMRDHETGTHMECVALLTKLMVHDLLEHQHKGHTISEQYGQDIIDAVKLHDLGKIGMPDSVLLKQDKLTKDELKTMQAHTTLGMEMLKLSIDKLGEDSLLWTAYEIVCGHHERWDGSGYPHGVQGDAIPLSARITAIVDVFDALTSSRPYKQAWSAKKAFQFIYEHAGVYFDPYLCEVVRRNEKQFAAVIDEKEAIASRTPFHWNDLHG